MSLTLIRPQVVAADLDRFTADPVVRTALLDRLSEPSEGYDLPYPICDVSGRDTTTGQPVQSGTDEHVAHRIALFRSTLCTRPGCDPFGTLVPEEYHAHTAVVVACGRFDGCANWNEMAGRWEIDGYTRDADLSAKDARDSAAATTGAADAVERLTAGMGR